MSRLPGEKLKKLLCCFLELLTLQIWALKTCNQNISKIIIANSLKLGQLIEDDE